jgi:hypothetical protein
MALEQFFGRIVDMVRRTDGDELEVAAGIAETVLTVGDTADFDETGGTVEINGDRYTYSEINDDAGWTWSTRNWTRSSWSTSRTCCSRTRTPARTRSRSRSSTDW